MIRSIATEGTEFTKRCSLMPSRQPSPEPGCSQIRKGLASPLCVLGDLCGLNSSGMRALISSHRGHRVHREMLPDAIEAALVSAGLLSDRARPKRRATSGNGCRSVKSLAKSGSGSGSISALFGALPSWTAQTSPPSCVRIETTRLRHPVSPVRMPCPILSIPRPIATPTPILLRH